MSRRSISGMQRHTHASQPARMRGGSQQFPARPRFASQAINESVDLTQSQGVSDEELNAVANTVVIMALNLAASGKPFKRSELLQGVQVRTRSGTEHILTQAKNKLESVYGLDLVDLKAGKYILVVPKSTPYRNQLADQSTGASAFSSLLGVVLSLIYFQKGRLSEEYLKTSMLLKLFPDFEVRPHPYFGNVDKLFQEFEQQVYIAREVDTRGGETKTFLKWGIRAELEFNKKSLVLPVLNAIFGGNVPNSVLEDLEKDSEQSLNTSG